jgi:hypothetical protein
MKIQSKDRISPTVQPWAGEKATNQFHLDFW